MAGEILDMKALTYEAMNEPDRALAEIRKSIDVYHREFPDHRLPYFETHTRLLALNGLFDGAEQYRIFLDIWKDADPGFDEIADAKARLKKLSLIP